MSSPELLELPQNIVEAGNIDRQKFLGNIQIKDIVSAPGHRRLRNEENVFQLAEHFFNLGVGSNIILNVLVDPKPHKYKNETLMFKVQTVECFDGHHRLVASLIGDHWKTVKDIPEDRLVILINGKTPGGGDQWERWIPLEVATRSSLEWKPVSSREANGQTASIDGSVSSRDTRFAEEDRGVPVGSIAQRILRLRNK